MPDRLDPDPASEPGPWREWGQPTAPEPDPAAPADPAAGTDPRIRAIEHLHSALSALESIRRRPNGPAATDRLLRVVEMQVNDALTALDPGRWII